jgi:hypothetical protein
VGDVEALGGLEVGEHNHNLAVQRGNGIGDDQRASGGEHVLGVGTNRLHLQFWYFSFNSVIFDIFQKYSLFSRALKSEFYLDRFFRFFDFLNFFP